MNLRSYGIHWADGKIAFLHQNGPTQYAAPVAGLISPFSIERRISCPHAIDLKQAVTSLPPEADDPLVRCLLPVPHHPAKPRCSWILDDGGVMPLVEKLVELSSPTQDQVHPLWLFPLRDIGNLVAVTNCTALVLTGATAAASPRIERLLEVLKTSQRRVLFVAEEVLPAFKGLTRIKTELTLEDVEHLPWRGIGSRVVFDYMLTGEIPI